jgi:hypothetical protein
VGFDSPLGTKKNLTLQGEKTRDGKDEIRDKKYFPRQGKIFS